MIVFHGNPTTRRTTPLSLSGGRDMVTPLPRIDDYGCVGNKCLRSHQDIIMDFFVFSSVNAVS